MIDSKYSKATIEAYDKGYRVVSGEVISPFSGIARKLYLNDKGYFVFNVRDSFNMSRPVKVHKLIAYQKFGESALEDDVQVRHLDGDCLNNLDYNIDIGSAQENALDRDEQTRLEHAIVASTIIRKFSDEEVDQIRNFYYECRSYKKTMEEFNISSKGSLHHIINNKYVTTK